MRRIAQFIVEKRKLIILLFIAAMLLSLITGTKVRVADDINEYLPEYTETRQGLEVMDNFITYSTARVMVRNVSYESAEQLAYNIGQIENVRSTAIDDTEKHYKDNTALIDVTFSGNDNDEVCIKALADVKSLLSDYDISVSTTVGYDMSDNMTKQMSTVGLLSAIVVIILLLLTSRSYAEVPPLLMTFGMAAILQWGSNYMFGTISFISNSLTLVLQLALAIDYSVILCTRFAEEKLENPAEEAMINALTNAIPEVFASSLTTIGGLTAMMFMQFTLGFDVGRVLIKAILISLLTVFMFLPGMLLAFSNAIDKTKHRSFIPKVDALGKFAWKTRHIVPPVFLVVLVAAFIGTVNRPLAYNYQETLPLILNESYQANKDIREVFGFENMVAVVVPAGDYDKEARMLDEMSQTENVSSVLGLASYELDGGYRLSDKMTAPQFAKFAGLDSTSSQYLFAYYRAGSRDVNSGSWNVNTYEVPIVDLFEFLYDSVSKGNISLDEEKTKMVEELHAQLSDAQGQLQSLKYDRMLVYADVSVESKESHELVGKLHEIAADYYGENVYVVGEATCARDLQASFQKDNILISLLSALFVVLVIVLTFRSFGLAVLLIAVIQGSIWINFSIAPFPGNNLYFLAYLIVSAMQMGANIDYAIVVSNRYLECREQLPRRVSIIIAMNKGISTILTSGSILAIASILIAVFSSAPAASHIGLALGRGTAISLVLVLFVLPQILLWGDRFIDVTSFHKAERSIFRSQHIFDSDFEEFALSSATPAERERLSAAAANAAARRRQNSRPALRRQDTPKQQNPQPPAQIKKSPVQKPQTRKQPQKKRRFDDFEDIARDRGK